MNATKQVLHAHVVFAVRVCFTPKVAEKMLKECEKLADEGGVDKNRKRHLLVDLLKLARAWARVLRTRSG